MTTIRTFFLQFRALFLIFEKGQGRPLKVEKIFEYGIKMQKNSKTQKIHFCSKFNLHSHKIFGANKRILLAYGINMQKNSKQLFFVRIFKFKVQLRPSHLRSFSPYLRSFQLSWLPHVVHHL